MDALGAEINSRLTKRPRRSSQSGSQRGSSRPPSASPEVEILSNPKTPNSVKQQNGDGVDMGLDLDILARKLTGRNASVPQEMVKFEPDDEFTDGS